MRLCELIFLPKILFCQQKIQLIKIQEYEVLPRLVLRLCELFVLRGKLFVVGSKLHQLIDCYSYSGKIGKEMIWVVALVSLAACLIKDSFSPGRDRAADVLFKVDSAARLRRC